jgi:hypothetical protein
MKFGVIIVTLVLLHHVPKWTLVIFPQMGFFKKKINYEKNIIGSNVNSNVIDFKC